MSFSSTPGPADRHRPRFTCAPAEAKPGCSFVSLSLDETKSTGGLQTTQSEQVSFSLGRHGPSKAKQILRVFFFPPLWKEEKARRNERA